MPLTTIIRIAAPTGALIAALLVTGCGGGAGGSSGSTSTRASVPITSANQDAVASAALNATLGGTSAASAVPLGAADRAAAASASGAATRWRTRLIDFAVQSAFAPLQPGSTIKQAMAARPQTTLTRSDACAAGGSVTVTLNDVDNNQAASAGDSASVAFLQCRPSATELVTGSVSLTYTSLAVTATRADVAATLSFANLAAQAPEGAYSINGPVTLSASRQGAVTTSQIVIGAGGLALAASTPTHSESLTLGAALTLAATQDDAALPPNGGSAGLTTVRIDGAVASSRLAGGTIVISTPVPVKAYTDDPYPREGQIVVSGAANSKLRLTAASITTLRIELDANGDGIYETSVDRPWGDVI